MPRTAKIMTLDKARVIMNNLSNSAGIQIIININ